MSSEPSALLPVEGGLGVLVAAVTISVCSREMLALGAAGSLAVLRDARDTCLLVVSVCFGEVPVEALCLLFHWVVCLFVVELWAFFIFSRTGSWSDTGFPNVPSAWVGCPFTFVFVSLIHRSLAVMKSSLSVCPCFWCFWSHSHCQTPGPEDLSLLSSSEGFSLSPSAYIFDPVGVAFCM